jgi:hypothetical protein
MSNNDKTNGYNKLKVSKFDHTSTTPGAMRWREWVVKLRYSFGSAHPSLANQPSEVLGLWSVCVEWVRGKNARGETFAPPEGC